MEEKIITGNYFNKYESQNPLYKKLMDNFMDNMLTSIKSKGYDELNILETGCGEGHLANILLDGLQNVNYKGFDIENDIVNEAKQNCPNADIKVGSIYELDEYLAKKYQFVITSEVFEHLETPDKAAESLMKLNTDFFIITVPREPVWRMLNLMRLKYVKDLGNTPGHLQHWSKSSFKKFLDKYFKVEEIKSVFPWTFAICTKK